MQKMLMLNNVDLHNFFQGSIMKRFIIAAVITIVFLSSCRAPGVEQTSIPNQQDNSTATTQSTDTNLLTSTPDPTATSQPVVSLALCTAALPDNLFPYIGSQSAAKENILSMIYPEPFIRTEAGLEPLILAKTPTQADGDLRLVPVSVHQGQTVVDSRGELLVLKRGVTVRPSGCRDQSCAVTWDGETDLQMDRMEIDFTLREGLTWSDGMPVSGSDSVLSYTLASAPEAIGLKWSEARTESYTSKHPATVQWVGRPGFTTAQISHFFWNPLPGHLFNGDVGWDAASTDERLADMPLSYGPFVLSGRDSGVIRFIPNPYDSQSQSVLNRPDEIMMRVIEGGPQQAWDAMQAGTCDVLDVSFGLENDPDILASVQADDRFAVHAVLQENWMQFVFGIQPASYDDFYNFANGDRPDILGDARTRQGFAHCLDRDALLESTMIEWGEVWHSFLPPDQSLLVPEDLIAQDPALGIQQLVQVGWRDHDNNPSTPMQAWEVPGVPIGTRLTAELLITPTAFHRDLADSIVESLGRCGIEVSIMEMPAASLYASGPSGPLFGRNFDLALISWQPMTGPDCGYYQSWQIPTAENQWIGTNIAGFSNLAFDDSCSEAALALPGEVEQAVYQAEVDFLAELPAVPLFSSSRLMVISESVCLKSALSSTDEFFNHLGSIGISDQCP